MGSLTLISDEEFTLGLEYLIKHKIITAQNSMLTDGILEQNLPSWLQKNAELWSQRSLSDSEFGKSIQVMISNRFIKKKKKKKLLYL